MYGSQLAYDNAEPDYRDDELDGEVYEALKSDFDDEWLCHTEIPEKAMAVLTKFAHGFKPNDLELHTLKTELSHAYDIALEHYSDDNFEKKQKQLTRI